MIYESIKLPVSLFDMDTKLHPLLSLLPFVPVRQFTAVFLQLGAEAWVPHQVLDKFIKLLTDTQIIKITNYLLLGNIARLLWVGRRVLFCTHLWLSNWKNFKISIGRPWSVFHVLFTWFTRSTFKVAVLHVSLEFRIHYNLETYLIV